MRTVGFFLFGLTTLPVAADNTASVHVWINIVLVFCVVPQYQVECASNAMHLKLIKDLFKDQAENAYLRPVNDTNEAVSVGFRFTPTISVLVSCRNLG
ncbi:hypothetical protein HOLleu_06780 [Holothuria leucospilota]|uniref:Uncharacterized protein n=1 Tax=Holothuria leucospilota TaxID=206669 RepID=A0A9Q1CLD8_HOLLE|nr:hypothetical protein HOLleu_06780 [Holothuria leucospilota]